MLLVLCYYANMIEEINNVVVGLEQSDDREVAQVTGLSEADVSAVRSTPLWRLRDRLLKDRDDSK